MGAVQSSTSLTAILACSACLTSGKCYEEYSEMVRCLKRRPRPAQKRQFFGRRGAAQYRVAMRVAPKAVDDGVVPTLKVQVVFHARLCEQREGLLMNHGRFAMHIRHVDKHALGSG